MEFSESVWIERSPDEVFAYVTDVERWPEWRLALVSAERAAIGPLAPGSTVHASGQMMGRSIEMDVEVTAVEAGRMLGIRARGGPATIDGTFRFAAEGAGTRVTIAGTIEPTGVFRAAAPILGRQVHEMWTTDLAALKGMLED